MPPAFILSQDQTLHLICSLCFRFRVSYCSKLTFPIQFSKIEIFFRGLLSRATSTIIPFLATSSQAFFSSFFEVFFDICFVRHSLDWRSFIIPKHTPLVNTFFRLFSSFFNFFIVSGCKFFFLILTFILPSILMIIFPLIPLSFTL